jgi:hypothetical protein
LESGPSASLALWSVTLRAESEVLRRLKSRVTDNDVSRTGLGEGNQADVFCYGIAFHYRRHIADPAKSRTFVGSYDIHLARTLGSWRIDRLRFNLGFIDGNQELEKAI